MPVCRHYEKGYCMRGDNCGFRHPKKICTLPEYKPFVETDPNFKTLGYIKLGCLDFRATGQCAKGRQCLYIHENPGTFGKGFSTVLEKEEDEN